MQATEINMTFTQKLQRAVRSSNSVLCVGLDPDPALMPAPLKNEIPDKEDLVYEFCRRIIEATKTEAVAYKPNLAFFEALGAGGWKILDSLLDIIPPGKITIADAKRGDIGSTAKKYKEAFFDRLAVDAITLNPLMGMDTLDPFLDDKNRAIFVLALTSNEGSTDFLQKRFSGRLSLSEYIAEQLLEKQVKAQTHIGMVVGATHPNAVEHILKANRKAHLLIPGVGAQGGKISVLQQLLQNHRGIPVINSSRSIIYAGHNQENWEEIVKTKASEIRSSLQNITQKYL